MKVIFIQDVKNVGRRGEIKEVADGYAKNFLLLRGLATLVTEKTIQKINQAQIETTDKTAKLKAKIQALKNDGALVFWLKSGKKGEIYGSITQAGIEEELCKKGFEDIKVHIAKPIKIVGEHDIDINVGLGITDKIKILIKPKEL